MSDQPISTSGSRPPDEETRPSGLGGGAAQPSGPQAGSSATGAGLTYDRVTLETPRSSGSSASAPPAGLFPGYKIVREIHRGGQGVVYQAIQQSTRRKVAIKVMKEGPFASAADTARFEREVHILGRLNHPNVVAIHESGVVAGNYFLVMDYISGQPLDEYVQNTPRSQRETLVLFAKICEAVNAAHLRGIIHRDLKPSNIRVDTEGEPHVLDFGLAKTLLGDSESSMMTITGQFMGSLPWASPEQAEAIPSKIDLRTDVYSLGVILYQMLSGRLPYEVTGNFRDVLDRIIRTEPARPSTIRKHVDDEIEMIALKCLAKERERRYQSAGELARDIRRYLAGEAIEAKRDSAWYVIGKTVRRHRVPAAFALAFVVLLVAFGVSMTFAYQQASDGRRRAEVVASFLENILTTVDPDSARADYDGPLHRALRATLNNAAARIDELRDDQETQARVRNTLGRVYLDLGEYPAAESQLRAAVETRRQLYGDQNAATADSLDLLGQALKQRAIYADAEQQYSAALAIRRGLFGDQNLVVAQTLNDLGQLYFAQRQYADAERLLRDALQIRRRLRAPERDIATSAANLGSALRDMDRLAEAEPLLVEALEIRRRLFGDEHFHTVVSKNKLGLLRRDTGNLEGAQELLEQALQDRIKLLGENHPDVAASLNNLALVLRDRGRPDEAIGYYERAISIWREKRDPKHNYLARGLMNLAVALGEAGEYPQAVARCEEALTMLPPDSVDRAQALGVLGRLHLDHANAGAAESYLRAAFDLSQQLLGATHRGTSLAKRDLGACLRALRQYPEAEQLLLESEPGIVKAYGDRNREAARTFEELAQLYTEIEQPGKAAEYRARLSVGGAAGPAKPPE